MNIEDITEKYLTEGNQVWLVVKPDGSVLHKLKSGGMAYVDSPFDTAHSKVQARKTANGALNMVTSSKEMKTVEAMERETYLKLWKGKEFIK